jgi:hypothetical protein
LCRGFDHASKISRLHFRIGRRPASDRQDIVALLTKFGKHPKIVTGTNLRLSAGIAARQYGIRNNLPEPP